MSNANKLREELKQIAWRLRFHNELDNEGWNNDIDAILQAIEDALPEYISKEHAGSDYALGVADSYALVKSLLASARSGEEK